MLGWKEGQEDIKSTIKPHTTLATVGRPTHSIVEKASGEDYATFLDMKAAFMNFHMVQAKLWENSLFLDNIQLIYKEGGIYREN